MSEQPHTVFVSHAHADNVLCDRYVESMRQRGLDVWYDRSNLQGGQWLGKEIERELGQRTALVVLLTPASVASYWVHMEVSAFRDLAAHDAGRLLLPVRIVDCPVPLLMRGLFWIDALSLGFDAAVDSLAKALGASRANSSASAPHDLAALIAQGTKLDEQMKYNAALAVFQQVLALDSSNSAGWVGKGSALISLHRNDEALAAFEQALSLDPSNVFAWEGKGDVLYWVERYDEALAAYEQALTLDPVDEIAWRGKGEVLWALECLPEAKAAFERADELISRK